MIKSITVTNPQGESLKLELAAPEKTGLAITSITGLGPVKADINCTDLATSDGSIFNSARLGNRNIVLKLQYMFNPTIEDVRLLTYKYFPIRKKVKLLIETDNRIAETSGVVESNDPDIFSKQETTQISIVCPDPFFYSAGENGNNITVFYGVEDNFEFPFSNESLTEDLIEFGIVTYSTERVIRYLGDADIGVVIRIYFTGPVKNLSIYNVRTREFFRIDTDRLKTMTGSELIQGDEVTISTVKGDKYVTLLREGEEYNILNCMDRQSTWLTLTQGDNIIGYTADDGGSNLQFRIENRIVYEGV